MRLSFHSSRGSNVHVQIRTVKLRGSTPVSEVTRVQKQIAWVVEEESLRIEHKWIFQWGKIVWVKYGYCEVPGTSVNGQIWMQWRSWVVAVINLTRPPHRKASPHPTATQIQFTDWKLHFHGHRGCKMMTPFHPLFAVSIGAGPSWNLWAIHKKRQNIGEEKACTHRAIDRQVRRGRHRWKKYSLRFCASHVIKGNEKVQLWPCPTVQRQWLVRSETGPGTASVCLPIPPRHFSYQTAKQSCWARPRFAVFSQVNLPQIMNICNA